MSRKRLTPVLAIGLLFAPAVLGAQVRGLPVVVSGVARGPMIGLAIGIGNDDAGGTTTLGAHLATGMGPVSLSAMVSRGAPLSGDDAVWSEGLAAQVELFGGPFVPFRVTLGAGVATWDRGVISNLHVPIALGLAATIPNPAFAIRPWLAPRLSIHRQDFESVGQTDSHLGLSGGIDLAFLNGMVVRVSYDREFADGSAAGILGFGFAYALGRH